MQQLLLKNAIKKRLSDGKMDFHLISAGKDGLGLLNCLNQAPGKKKTNCRISTSYLGCTHFLELCVICFALYLISFFPLLFVCFGVKCLDLYGLIELVECCMSFTDMLFSLITGIKGMGLV